MAIKCKLFMSNEVLCGAPKKQGESERVYFSLKANKGHVTSIPVVLTCKM